MQTAMGTAQQLHLDRAARIAGEAFAFEETETAPVASHSGWTNALWLAVAAAAGCGLWLAF